jgi:hypothetical protein
MRKETTKEGKHTILFYDSARDLPIRRYQKFNKYIMIAMQVGDSIADYDKRMVRANGYLASEDCKSAIVEITNQRQTLHHALEEYSPQNFALALMVHSIDGGIVDEYSDDALNGILDTLDKIGFTKNQADTTLDAVKKK